MPALFFGDKLSIHTSIPTSSSSGHLVEWINSFCWYNISGLIYMFDSQKWKEVIQRKGWRGCGHWIAEEIFSRLVAWRWFLGRMWGPCPCLGGVQGCIFIDSILNDEDSWSGSGGVPYREWLLHLGQCFETTCRCHVVWDLDWKKKWQKSPRQGLVGVDRGQWLANTRKHSIAN